MVKIEGFDKLNRDIKDAQKALDELGDELGTVSFNPDDPVSIEGAIATMEQTIDQRVGRYARNSIIGPLITELKETYRQAILDKAAEARSNSSDN
ncbi:MAG TPA: hypothetical protein DF715_13400 [Oceanicaulis sp.]|nr:hypothetical protein [Oceanicaulis sp.]